MPFDWGFLENGAIGNSRALSSRIHNPRDAGLQSQKGKVLLSQRRCTRLVNGCQGIATRRRSDLLISNCR
jgi:hypothetical protein